MTSIRSVESLCQALADGTRVKYVLFWGHKEVPGRVTKACMSQWYPAPFISDEIHYPTAEHYMMAQKARLFGDHGAFRRIVRAGHPGEAKEIGREVRGFDQALWTEHRFDIVVQGNLAKFGQDPKLSAYLLGTAPRVLVEASPVDRVWGVGLAADHPDIREPDRWQGENLLGFALMEVRQRLASA